MPPAIAGVVAAGVAAGIGAGITAGVTAGIVVGVLTIALGLISLLLAPKPKKPSLEPFGGQLGQGRTQQVQEPITPWSIVYGEVRKSGPVTFIGSTSNNQFLHLVVTLASHEVQSIDEIIVNETPVYDDMLDGSGNVTSGKFSGHLRIKKHLGTAGQTADSDLVSEVTEWTTSERGRERAYIYLRFKFNRDIYTSFPKVSAWVKGKKITDTRDSTEKWINNSAQVINDYLTTAAEKGGPGFDSTNINSTRLNSSSNICDEMVDTEDLAYTISNVDFSNNQLDLTLPNDTIGLDLQTGDRVQISADSTGTIPTGLSAGTDYYIIPARRIAIIDPDTPANDRDPAVQLASSLANAYAGTAVTFSDAGADTLTLTKNAEPRYTANYAFDVDRPPFEILDDLKSSMAGIITHVGNAWEIFAGAWTASSITLTEDDARGEIDVARPQPRSDSFNAVKGVYTPQRTNGVPTDYPALTSATFESQDNGERIFTDLPLPATTRGTTAERISKIFLLKHRQDITCSYPASLAAYQEIAGLNIAVTDDEFGWASKDFEINELTLVSAEGEHDVPVLRVDLLLRETDSTVYDWTSSEEQGEDPAPNTNLPNALLLEAPSGLNVISGNSVAYVKNDGTVVSRLLATWTDPTDGFFDVIEVQYKRTADSNYEPGPVVDPGVEQVFIWDVEDGDEYEVRVRAKNVYGGRSSFVSDTATASGKTDAPSDVTNFTAAQKGDVVNFTWDQVSDSDLAGYEIKFSEQGQFTWEEATSITKVTRGTAVTSALVPTGSWTFGIKAFNTSGVESVNAATSDADFDAGENVVDSRAQAPEWYLRNTSSSRGYVRHHTGVLVPQSTSAADELDFEVFDECVPNAVSKSIYEGPEFDLNKNDSVLIFGNKSTHVAPGSALGSDFAVQIDSHLDGGAYDGFSDFGIGSRTVRKVKLRLFSDNASGVSVVKMFTPSVDLNDRTETHTAFDITADSGGTVLTFDEAFILTPSVEVTLAEASNKTVSYDPDSVTTTQVTLYAFDGSTGTPVAAKATVVARGA